MSAEKIEVFENVETLNAAVVSTFLALAKRNIAEQERFRVSLSGGSTPKKLYQSLAREPLDWNCIQWFWGDERNVPLDHSDSNYRMVREALLDPAHIPANNCFPVPVDLQAPATAAQAYETTLKAQFGDVPYPDWDLVLLGLGDDAHTASLFPETAALNERDRWFVENWVPKFDTFRYTLTAPAINSGREIWFLITGASKREALAKLLSATKAPALYPSQLINPTRFFVTTDAYP